MQFCTLIANLFKEIVSVDPEISEENIDILLSSLAKEKKYILKTFLQNYDNFCKKNDKYNSLGEMKGFFEDNYMKLYFSLDRLIKNLSNAEEDYTLLKFNGNFSLKIKNELFIALLKQYKSPYLKNKNYEVTIKNKKYIVRLDKSAHLEHSKRPGYINLYIHGKTLGSGMNAKTQEIEGKILLKYEGDRIFSFFDYKSTLKNKKLLKISNICDDEEYLKGELLHELKGAKISKLSKQTHSLKMTVNNEENLVQGMFVQYKADGTDLSKLITPKIRIKPSYDTFDTFKNDVLYLSSENESTVKCYFLGQYYNLSKNDIGDELYVIKNAVESNTLEKLNFSNKSKLFTAMSEKCKKPFFISAEDKLNAIFVILLAYQADVQKHNMVHRDIKPSNIIFNNNSAKIIDYGDHVLLHSLGKVNLENAGTKLFIPPEGSKNISANYDTYALGITILQILFGYDEKYLELSKLEKHKEDLPKMLHPVLDMVKKMCMENPKFRLNINEAIMLAAELNPVNCNRFFIETHMLLQEYQQKKDNNLSNKLSALLTSFSTYLLSKEITLDKDTAPLKELMKQEMANISDNEIVDLILNLQKTYMLLVENNVKNSFGKLIHSLLFTCLNEIKNLDLKNSINTDLDGFIKNKEILKINKLYVNTEEKLDLAITSLKQELETYEASLMSTSKIHHLTKNKLTIVKNAKNILYLKPNSLKISQSERIKLKKENIRKCYTELNKPKNIKILDAHRCGFAKKMLKVCATIVIAPIWWLSRSLAYKGMNKVWDTKGNKLRKSAEYKW